MPGILAMLVHLSVEPWSSGVSAVAYGEGQGSTPALSICFLSSGIMSQVKIKPDTFP